ncbi:glycosyltransferase family 4 protein [Psychroserpens ponticola]|uniref:Glycosyltransferase family 4 protein n=1 Tax=Psychroserpens ponticola TaxID=2932268 RepID=A0ABY7RZG6_9FLAO|nr:glycosyltransferase family 4 protein [Psychroserpens ponticola]WCO02530.1 glycosyltransferase family 4 protein [Psychroserpens ponticola]
MKNDVLIIYGSLNSVPSPEGAAPAKVIYETVETLNNKAFKVLSNYNPRLNQESYNKEVYLHVKSNRFDALVLLILKLRYPFKKRKQKFTTGSDKQLLYFISVCRFLLFKKHKKIVVHVSVGLVTMIKLFLPSRKVVYFHHGTSLHKKYDEQQWCQLISNCEAIFSVNKRALEMANQTFKKQLEPSRYFAIPNAIIPKVTLSQAVDYYKNRPYDEHVFVFAFSGRICIEKGVLNLLHAFKNVHDINHDVHLVVFGAAGTRGTHEIKTEYLLDCKAFAESQNIPVTFTGFLPNEDLLKGLSQVDVLILPTDTKHYEEGMPLSLIEAMSLSKPLIATNSGGSSEILNDGQNGILITSNPYIDELTKAMLNLSSNKELYAKFSKTAYTSYIENHSYESYNKAFIKALKAINFFDE